MPLVEHVAHAPHLPSFISSVSCHHVGGEPKEQILSQKQEPRNVQVFCESSSNEVCSSLTLLPTSRVHHLNAVPVPK